MKEQVMKVVWKRPDGFHQAHPEDYRVISIGSEYNLWLHKKDEENFPFRLSGGWQDEELSKKLNKMVNLLDHPIEQWVSFLKSLYNKSPKEQPQDFLKETQEWVNQLKTFLKGDGWEVIIMTEVLSQLTERLTEATPLFLKAK